MCTCATIAVRISMTSAVNDYVFRDGFSCSVCDRRLSIEEFPWVENRADSEGNHYVYRRSKCRDCRNGYARDLHRRSRMKGEAFDLVPVEQYRYMLEEIYHYVGTWKRVSELTSVAEANIRRIMTFRQKRISKRKAVVIVRSLYRERRSRGF